MTDSPAQSSSETSLNPIHITDEDAFEAFVSKDDSVLIDFYADWCGPCQMMAPKIDELAAKNEDSVAKVDIEEAPQIASQYNVSSIPTFLIFNNSEIKERLIGMQELDALEQLLD